jgi:hypothetical protein
MKKIAFLFALGAGISYAASAMAGPIDASATVSAIADGPNWDYTITLKNLISSTDSVQTFWYAWVPGADFLPTSPSSVSSPTGWTDQITHFPNVSTNGYAIQFVTTSAALTPGSELEFKFTSADTPAQLAGDSPFYPGTPVGTSFLYSGAPFQGDSLQFVVTSVPEPSTLTLALVGGLVWFAGLRVRKALANH